jgi:hypothetical protein
MPLIEKYYPSFGKFILYWTLGLFGDYSPTPKEVVNSGGQGFD